MERIDQYEILEPQTPDLGGIVYKARDTKSKQLVALRKLKPFGMETEELNQEQLIAFKVALGRLSSVDHPFMRRVIGGNIDPNDGMPYIVSPWVEATPLQSLLSQGPLPKSNASRLVCKAMEVSDLISGLLAEEAIWTETDIDAIAVVPGEGQPDYLYWVSPMLGLTRYKNSRDLSAIADLTEELIGKSADDESPLHADPLETWLKWLKGSAGKVASLHEAREVLSASVGVDPPKAVEKLIEDAKISGKHRHRLPNLQIRNIKRPKMPLFLLLCCLLVIEAGAGWMWVQYISRSHEEQVEKISEDWDKSLEDFLDMDDSQKR